MDLNNTELVLLIISSSLLIGCGGGVGSPAVKTPRTTVAFTSFADLQPNTYVVVDGMSQPLTVEVNAATAKVTSTLVGVFDDSNSSITLGYGAYLDHVNITTPVTDLTWSEAVGDSAVDSGAVLTFENAAATAGFDATDALEPSLDWNYQTFGIWQDLSVSGNVATYKMGAISGGNQTSGLGIPIAGSANYTGLAFGYFTDASNDAYGFLAAAGAGVDFSTRSINFFTTTTTTQNIATDVQTPNTGYNLSGTLTYSAATNNITGTVTSANSNLSGSVNARFYGPAAEEMGGTFSLTGTGTQAMVGGFGMKR